MPRSAKHENDVIHHGQSRSGRDGTRVGETWPSAYWGMVMESIDGRMEKGSVYITSVSRAEYGRSVIF